MGEELARVLKDGFSDKEISDGITALLNYRNLARAQDDVVAGVWLDYLERGRTFAWSADMDKKISALTPDVVNAAMRKYLRPDAFSTAVAGDFKKSGALTPNSGSPAAAACLALFFWRAVMMRRPACTELRMPLPHAGAAPSRISHGRPPPRRHSPFHLWGNS